MAKLLTSFDLGESSPLVNIWATPAIVNKREWGALEYDNSLVKNSSGAKVLTPHDFASYNQIINRAGTSPTVSDMRGATILSTQREWGVLEYNSAIAFHTSVKLVSAFDLAGYSQMVNYVKPTTSSYLPTVTDLRGATVRLNTRFAHNTDLYFPTTSDIRDTDEIDGWREMGAMEYDDTLAIANDFPTVTEMAAAVWSVASTTLKGTDYVEKIGGYAVSQVVRSSVASTGGASTITLDAGSSTVDDFYNMNVITILSGTGAGQTRKITDYVGSTRVVTVDSAWTTTPDQTSVFAVRPFSAAPSAAETADAVWDEATSGHVTTGTFGKLVQKILKVLKWSL